jgi:hypothetical protein
VIRSAVGGFPHSVCSPGMVMDVSKVDEAGKAYRTGNDIAVKPNLRELARFSLRLGTTAFGGPAAHIAMMEDEVVRRRQWVA